MVTIYNSIEDKLEAGFKKLLLDPRLNFHPNYNFTNSVFKGQVEPITFRCDLHNKDITIKKAAYLKSEKNRCEECEAEFIEFYQTEGFIAKANRKFNSKFNYSKVEDYRYKEPVTIICPNHGEYRQIPHVHLRSACGCTKCGEEYATKTNLVSNWSREAYINKVGNRTSNVYVIKITGNNESFYKIGITCKKISQRFKSNKYLSEEYSIEVKHIFKDLEASVAYDFEKLLHTMNKEYKYKPLIKFGGYTECFTEVPTDLKQYQDLLETITAI